MVWERMVELGSWLVFLICGSGVCVEGVCLRAYSVSRSPLRRCSLPFNHLIPRVQVRCLHFQTSNGSASLEAFRENPRSGIERTIRLGNRLVKVLCLMLHHRSVVLVFQNAYITVTPRVLGAFHPLCSIRTEPKAHPLNGSPGAVVIT